MVEPTLAVDLELQLPGVRVRPRFTAGNEMVVMFGPSGAGKSLTLRALAGLIRPAGGSVRLGDRLLDDARRGIHLRPQDRRVGYVPQNYALFPHLTVWENVAFGLRGLTTEARRRRVDALLERMRLSDRAGWRPGELSGGQQQRAALARALAPSPQMLLMDEPLAAVEEPLRMELREEVRRIQAQDQIPVVLVTHSLAEAYSLADLLVVVVSGEVRQADERERVFRHPANPEVARLVGMTNILHGRAEGRDGEALLVRWRDQVLRAVTATRPELGHPAALGIRPEDLMVLREPPPADARENVLAGTVETDQPQGYDHLLGFRVEGVAERLTIRIPHPVVMRLGIKVSDRRYLAIRPDAIHVFSPESARED